MPITITGQRYDELRAAEQRVHILEAVNKILREKVASEPENELKNTIAHLSTMLRKVTDDRDFKATLCKTYQDTLDSRHAQISKLTDDRDFKDSLIKGYVASIKNRDDQIKEMDIKIGKLKDENSAKHQAYLTVLQNMVNKELAIRSLKQRLIDIKEIAGDFN